MKKILNKCKTLKKNEKKFSNSAKHKKKNVKDDENFILNFYNNDKLKTNDYILLHRRFKFRT